MSSIESKSSADALSQLKDTYVQKDRESEARHRDEIRALRESHQVEMEALRKDTQSKIDHVQEEASAKLSQKDMQNQKEIEAVRAMYQKRQQMESASVINKRNEKSES